MVFDEGPLRWIQPIFFIIILGLTIALMLKQASEMRRLEEAAARRREFVTIVSCGSKEVRRSFEEGDYVGKNVDCGEGAKGIIKGIIVKEEKVQEKKSKGLKSLFRL